MAGIDTEKERNIFQYRPKIRRPIPSPRLPVEEPEVSLGEVYDERRDILEAALNTDAEIDALQSLIDEQLAGLSIKPIDMPGLEWALQQIGASEIDYDAYRKAKNILRNAAIASTCVDPVLLVFAESSAQGPMIPRVRTKTPTCEEAADPNLFAPDPDVTDTISLNAAIDQLGQMNLYKTLLLTWYGLMMFVLRPILRMVERVIKFLKWTIVLRPITRIFKKIAKWLRGLICWSEKKIFGRYLSKFCQKGKPDRALGFEDEKDNDIEAQRRLCITDADIDPAAAPPSEPDPADCLEDDSGEDPPEAEGCPALIPPDCVRAAQIIMDAAKTWAIESDATHGNVNPTAMLVDLALSPIVDVQETGKFMLVSQDNSALSDKLVANTVSRPFSNNRYSHPMVQQYLENTRPERVSYQVGG